MSNYDSIIITLYKGRYEENDKKDIQYRTFGEFDYIKILDAPIYKKDSEIDYFKLWEKTEEVSSGLDVGESCHNLYAYSVKDNYKDKFWVLQQPYLFMSLLQLKTGVDQNLKEKADELISYLSKQSNNENNFKFAIYYSLDSCDFIIFIKCLKYEVGAKQIQSITRFTDKIKQSNSYCYSLCGIDFNCLCIHHNNDVIEKVMICFVVKDVVSYINWYTQFSREFPQHKKGEIKSGSHFNYNRLGNEDVCINIMHCDIKKLIAQMKEGGCLWIGNEDFKKGIMKLRIHFDTHPYINKLKSMVKQSCQNDVKICSHIDNYKRKVSDKAKRLLYPFVKKALEEVLKACSYLEEENFARDVRKCIKSAIDMLFIKMNEFCNKESTDDPDKNRIVYNESVVQVVQGIMSIVNGSLHTDRMFFQSPGFNAVLYDIPVKILAFYNNYVELLVDKLNDNKTNKSFCYLLCPDLYLSIKVQKLFDDRNEYPETRFLLGKIPVKAIFEPKKLMQELAHEVAHCVGDQIRMRKKRWEYMVAMFAETIATSMLSACDCDSESITILENIYDKIGDICKDELHEQLVLTIKKYFVKNFRLKEKKEEFEYYRIKTSIFFEGYMIRLLEEDLDKLLGCIEDKIEKYYKNKNRDIYEYTTDISELVMVLRNNVKLLIQNLRYIIPAVHTLVDESFADLVMCEVLGIEMDEYVELFYNTHKEEINDPSANFLNFSINATAERIVSVVRCYGKKIQELRNNITEENYSKYRHKLMIYSEEYNEDVDNKIKRLLPPAVIRNNKKYLSECREKIAEVCTDLEIIRKMYQVIIYGNVPESVIMLLNYPVDSKAKTTRLVHFLTPEELAVKDNLANSKLLN